MNTTMQMPTTEKNKAIVRRVFEEMLSKKRTELLKDVIDDQFEGFRGMKGYAGFLEPVKPLLVAFPDIEWKVLDLVSEGDKVMLRWQWTGTHKAQFTNFAATGKIITNDGMALYELKNGKIIAAHLLTDRLGFLQQMGAVPEDPSKLSAKKNYPDRVQFIDKFIVPSAARQAFLERMHINKEFIKKLPGFLEDVAYEHTDADGNLICVTVAQWASMDAVTKAKEAVQAEYKKQGFDPAEMFRRLNISLERYVCREMEEKH